LVEREFDDRSAALKARFRAEREGVWEGERLPTDVEIVVLGAESAEALRRTHGRYFFTVGELLRGVQYGAGVD
jgi:hypothetical protein